ncbi:MAG: 3-hydroxyacyl-CoA dehydrogenase NAD-binding domain-containing protein [Thermoanaerobaculia bacterium]|nr:3-hydroxyacyl-CoA dehydrogenase NAD-binding domain-containing protein [Thermoanaerobaculia bacterium]
MSSISFEDRPDGVAVLTFDVPGSKVNVLSSRLLGEFRAALDRVESEPSIRACVLRSGKEDNFIAGADLDEVKAMTTAEEASAFVREGHRLLDRVAASRKPFVAAIHGAALGGGLEVALACHYRIATSHSKTVLGLPEVMLGLLPAAGGTQRLPRLIGVVRALPMMLLGQRLRAAKAERLGLVDDVVEPGVLLEEATRAAARFAAGEIHSHTPGLATKVENAAPMRTLIIAQARKQVVGRTRGLYPAPHAIIECVETGLRRGFLAGQEKEIELFGRLAAGSESKSLIWIFDAMNELKKPRAASEPREVSTLAVIGGGLMGEGIAAVSLSICPVVVKDPSAAALARVRESLEASLAKRLGAGTISDADAASRRDRLTLSSDGAAVAGADLVIEAVFEDLELKRRVLAEAEAVIDDDAVFASNTSAIPIREIAAGARHPERVVGMHYFSPVPKMPLLEVVVTGASSERAIATACAFGTAQGKTVIVVRDGPGFYTTRILAPFMNEAILLLDEGAEILALDAALKDFGFPVGPVTLLDEVGIDVAAHVSEDLGAAFAARGLSSSPSLRKLHEAGFAGRKNGRGFFRYDGKDGKKPVNTQVYEFFGGATRKSIAPKEMVDRLSLVMVNEAVHCLEEQVLSTPRDGDIGAILGLGFPPIRGGPLHYVDATGPAAVVARMAELESRLGARFHPAGLLERMAAEGRRFYG